MRILVADRKMLDKRVKDEALVAGEEDCAQRCTTKEPT